MSVVEYMSSLMLATFGIPKGVWRVVQVPGTYHNIDYAELLMIVAM